MKWFIQQKCEKINLKSLCKVETEPVEMLLLNVGVTVVIKCGCIVYTTHIYTLSNFKIK